MKSTVIICALVAFMTACAPSPTSVATGTGTVKASTVQSPEWTKDAVIYQINTRQYSESGTFKAVERDLARIDALGVDILWFMPIHPIGEAKRKGRLGSPYAVKDFRAVNPDLGTLDDFKSLVDAAHAMGMKVIIDWVANHTAWDNPLITEHPEYFTRNAAGEMQHPPDTDWHDVADLDYSQDGLRDYMMDALLYWVEDVGIDGYRCDVAGMVPTDFWNSVRPKLDAIKPVFLLAEWQEPELHESAFDASYAWRWKEIMHDIVKGKAVASDVADYYTDYHSNWPKGAMRMTYTENHDQNSWDGNTDAIYGDAFEAALALSFVGDGIPLIYNGQESSNQKRLAFFDKDLIDWRDHPHGDLITKLTALKEKNSALWNGVWGKPADILAVSQPDSVFSFVRRDDKNTVLAVFNLSGEPIDVSFDDELPGGQYTDFSTNANTTITADTKLALRPWEYRIYTR